MNAPNYTNEYKSAEQRIKNTPKLQPFETTLLYEWPEGNEHYEWVATAPLAEIIDWAKTIEGDSAYMITTEIE